MAFNLSFFFHRTHEFRAYIEKIVSWISDRTVCLAPPTIFKVYKLENVADAHKDIESGLTAGKLVLKMN